MPVRLASYHAGIVSPSWKGCDGWQPATTHVYPSGSLHLSSLSWRKEPTICWISFNRCRLFLIEIARVGFLPAVQSSGNSPPKGQFSFRPSSPFLSNTQVFFWSGGLPFKEAPPSGKRHRPDPIVCPSGGGGGRSEHEGRIFVSQENYYIFPHSNDRLYYAISLPDIFFCDQRTKPRQHFSDVSPNMRFFDGTIHFRFPVESTED